MVDLLLLWREVLMIDSGLFHSPTKSTSASRKGTIQTFNNTLTMPTKSPEIVEMDNCIVVDNFLHSFDDFEQEVLKFPATNCHEINEILFYGDKEADYVGTAGITQPVSRDFISHYVKIIYDYLSEKDYMIPNPHNNDEFVDRLVMNSAAEATLFYEDMVVDSACNVPCPSGGEFTSSLFFDDDEEDNKKGITFYDFIFDGRSYSSLEDFMIEDDETKEKIFEIVGKYAAGSGKLELYEEFEESEYFKPTEYIEAKRNRLIAFKSCFFTVRNFSKGERYTFNCSFNVPKFN